MWKTSAVRRPGAIRRTYGAGSRSVIELSKAAIDLGAVEGHGYGEGDALGAIAPAVVGDEATVELSQGLAE